MQTIEIKGQCYSGGTHLDVTFSAAKSVIETVVIPKLTQFENISYVGVYVDNGNHVAKYMFDIGYDSYYLMIYQINMTIKFGLCKKDDTESTGNVLLDGTNINFSSHNVSGSYYVTVDIKIRVITNDKNEVYMIFTPTNTYYVFDETNLGHKCIFTANRALFDDGLFVNGANNFNQDSLNVYDMDDSVYITNIFAYQSSSFKGILKYMKNVCSNSMASGNLRLIEADGVRYRQLNGKLWIIDTNE